MAENNTMLGPIIFTPTIIITIIKSRKRSERDTQNEQDFMSVGGLFYDNRSTSDSYYIQVQVQFRTWQQRSTDQRCMLELTPII
jgi:hypothetical protein